MGAGHLCCALLTLSACTVILGDDFYIVPNDGAGGASTSSTGAGGSGGSGGTPEPPPPALSCTWELSEHEVVQSTQGMPFEPFGQPMFGVRHGPESMRAFVLRETGIDNYIEMWTLSTNQAPQVVTFPAHDMYQASRVTPTKIGVLYSEPGTMGPQLKLRVLSDTSESAGDERLLEDAFPLIDPAASGFFGRARMVALPGGDPLVVDFIAGYREGTTAKGLEAYGRWSHQTNSATAVVVTPTNLMIGGEDNTASALVHADGKSYGFFAGNVSGTREYILDGTGAEGPPRMLLPEKGILAFPGPGSDPLNHNFGLYEEGPPTRLLLGQVAPSELATFDPSEFAECLSVPTLADFPVSRGSMGFHGDIFAMVGIASTDDAAMRYQLYGLDGADRGGGELPFTAPLATGESREYLGEVAVVPLELDFAERGGRLHVLWFEQHATSSDSYQVMYYDRLRCEPTP